MTAVPIVFAGLMPHAPILVPGVGGPRLAEARATAEAMTTAAQRAVAAHPATLVLVSPHSPRRPGAFGIWQTARLRGSLGNFGSPGDRVDLPADRAFADRLITEARQRGLQTWDIHDEVLDHGAVVPLCYLVAAGWSGPTVILSLNYPGEGGLNELGGAIEATAAALDRRTAVIASGDMSHRLTRSAPGGYHPRAHRFDDTFIDLLRAGAADQVGRLDAALQEAAGEDVVDSTVIALAAAEYRTDGHRVLSYEGPFGVGYGVAILYEPAAGSARPAADDVRRDPVISSFEGLPAVARRAVAEKLGTVPKSPGFTAAGVLAQRRAVFVTLRTTNGDLRGCRGRLAPSQSDLVRETWDSALSSAFQDYRFSPLTVAELPEVEFSVTVLGDLEPVAGADGLDPAIYGVVVASADGRKGVLLPAIPGIDSVAQQLAIARQKAGIGPDEWIKIERFRADSYGEPTTGGRKGGHAD